MIQKDVEFDLGPLMFIMLRFFHDMTVPEISETIGEKEGTVKSRLHRGIEQLRKILMRHGNYGLGEREEKKNG